MKPAAHRYRVADGQKNWNYRSDWPEWLHEHSTSHDALYTEADVVTRLGAFEAALLWMADSDPQLVDQARAKFLETTPTLALPEPSHD